MTSLEWRRRRRVALGTRSYAPYVRALSPALWFAFNEQAGATAVNWGALGAAFNGAYVACTLAQAGRVGPADAVLYDGVNSLLTVPAGAYSNYSAFTVAALVNPSSAGEGGYGRFGDNNQASYLRFQGNLTMLNALRAATGAAQTTTTTGLSAGQWAWLFQTYDDGGDRKIRLYRGLSGAIAEYAYSAQSAATGTLTLQSGNALCIGNTSSQIRTFDGLFDEFLLFNRVLSASQMAQIVRLTGV